MFSFIKNLFSIAFILFLYFMIITFFSLSKVNTIEVSFDNFLPETNKEKLNKIFSYQIQFLKNIQTSNKSPDEFDKFVNAMLNSSIDLNGILFEMNFHKNKELNKKELSNLNEFINKIYLINEHLTKSYNSDKTICIRVLLNEAKNKLENIFHH